MLARFEQAHKRKAGAAFTLMEVVIALLALGIMMAGVIFGYAQINQLALWSSMSLSAQSYASEGAEQARAAKCDTQAFPQTNSGPGTWDELPPTNTPYTQTNVMDVPASGLSFVVTN